MTKRELAEYIERHHLYEPKEDGVYSKNYYRYSSEREISILMKMRKQELQDMFALVYHTDLNGNIRELSSSEIY